MCQRKNLKFRYSQIKNHWQDLDPDIWNFPRSSLTKIDENFKLFQMSQQNVIRWRKLRQPSIAKPKFSTIE